MSLIKQFLIIIGIPLLGMVIIFIVGIQNFGSIKKGVRALMELENERVTMVNADRDAYQAFLNERSSLETFDANLLNELDASNQENLQQTWERITEPGQNFTPKMQSQFTRFRTNYESWKKHSRQIIALSKETASENVQMLDSSAKAIEAFGRMRDNIDKLGELIDSQLGENVSPARRRELEKALSLVLNGDRDAYQAYLAQLLSIRVLGQEDMKQQDHDNEENIAQTGERFLAAAEISGEAANPFKSEFENYFSVWKENSRKAVQLAKQSLAKNMAKKTESEASTVAFETMRDAIDKLGEMQDERAKMGEENMAHSISNTITIYVVTVVIALILAMAVAFILIRSILSALFNCVELAEKVSEGDFQVSLESQRKDELGKLMGAMNKMAHMLRGAISSISKTMGHVSRGDFRYSMSEAGMTGELIMIKDSINKSIDMLSGTIAQVVTATEQVNSGADQISSASQSLASGTTEQAASLEEVSSSMSEVTSRVQANNENASQAAELATKTMGVADRGDTQMKDMLSSMNKINSSSADISKIIKVIDEIAFQTNLLALNAAVEAARAGKYGKGFAVVAEEVRNLAARSAEAAKNTTSLIENSVKEVESGVDNANKTAEVLSEITVGIAKVNDLVAEIAAASQEQSSNTNEISNALTQVNNVIQQNSSISEESASASEELSSQATELKAMMARFKLPDQKSGQEVKTEQPALEPVERVKQTPKMITLDDDDYGKY
ncbi:HAMP domain-containing protein [bacterium]|nr:HAMP domain-containing protein [bacterium]